MGQTARDTTKSDTQYRFRLSKELDARVDRAWREGALSDLDRQSFAIYLVKLGVEEHERRERLAKSTREDAEGDPPSPDKRRSMVGGA